MARWGCFLQYSRKFWKSVNCAKKTPYAAGIGVHKASTDLKMETTIFNLYFGYRFSPLHGSLRRERCAPNIL